MRKHEEGFHIWTVDMAHGSCRPCKNTKSLNICEFGLQEEHTPPPVFWLFDWVIYTSSIIEPSKHVEWLDSWLKGDQVCFKFVWSPSTSCLGLKSPKYQSALTPDGDDDDYDHNGVGDDDGD